MAYETIIVEIEDHVATIRLNRPDALNALNSQLLSELASALGEADSNEKVRCIILTGSQKAFAAGADIKEMSRKSFVEMFMSDFFGKESRSLQDTQAGHRSRVWLCAGRWMRAGDDVRFHHRVGHSQVRPARDQPWRHAGIGGTQRLTRFVGKVEVHGYAPHGPFHGCRGGRTLRAGQPRRAGQS